MEVFCFSFIWGGWALFLVRVVLFGGFFKGCFCGCGFCGLVWLGLAVFWVWLVLFGKLGIGGCCYLLGIGGGYMGIWYGGYCGGMCGGIGILFLYGFIGIIWKSSKSSNSEWGWSLVSFYFLKLSF